MSFYDFFFPEQAQATHLRSIASRSRRERRRESSGASATRSLEKRVEELEGNLGFVSLLLGSLLAQLDEQGHISRAELREMIREIDGDDGEQDGRLDIGVLRGLTRG